ncbi:hypothetical protein FAZ78_18665 [Cereibacter changlensis]|uniref:Bacterial surface antigen (D15) domain-containing protein n=1 Tax=Cereibacter changlensis TaxID=402884 RepID=A0A4U0YYQ2_9RHOB|nr:BamA/TamA family outer membrane protein [Cereibacter changlensis]TKA95101.1 hypothetical protein FAZ78_18665 [Cereibacter changlensis]
MAVKRLCAVAVLAAVAAGAGTAQDLMSGDEMPEAAEAMPGLDLQDPETGLIGKINAWLFYSSEDGVIGGASGTFNLPSGEGRWMQLGGEVAEKRQSLTGIFHQDLAFGTPASLDLTLRGSHDERRDALPFETTTGGLEARLTWPIGEAATLGTYLGFSTNRIHNPEDDLSPLLEPDVRRSERTALGADYQHTLDLGGGALSRLRFGLGGELASISSGESQIRAQASVLAGGLLADGRMSWRGDLRMGLLETSGGDSSIGDRFILGPATLRGFSYGGFGPRDGDQTLGGARYAAARFDVKFPQTFGESALMPGLHADLGSLWGLDNTGGGAVDDDAHLRASLGVTLSARFGAGSLDLSLSDAVVKRDGDDAQPLQLSFQSRF